MSKKCESYVRIFAHRRKGGKGISDHLVKKTFVWNFLQTVVDTIKGVNESDHSEFFAQSRHAR